LSGPQADGSHFDAVAEHYDASLPKHVVEHYLRKRTDFVTSHHPPPARVLDVGCGTGALAERLASRGYDVAGIDPSAGMLEVMRRRAPQVEAITAGGEELPFADGAFDLALTVATLHHIAAPEAVRATLAEMARVVHQGGHVLVWDHNPRNPYWPHLMRRVPQDLGKERLVPLDEILAGLEAAGATPLVATETGLVPDFTPPVLLNVAAGLERFVERIPGARRLCAHNVVLAEKGRALRTAT
jgi:SAM-dependent methyltransferase